MSSKKVNTVSLLLGSSGVKEINFNKDLLPEQKTKNTIDWVEFGTMPEWKNQQPQYYDFLSKMSSKNGGILKQKNRYVWGKGWEFNLLGLTRENEVALKGFMRSLNRTRVWKRLIGDRNKYGGFAVQMIVNKGSGTDKVSTKVVPHYLPFKNVRVGKKVYTTPTGKDEKTELEPTKYYFTSDWSQSNQKIKSAPDFTEFEPWDWDEENPDPNKNYIIYYKDEGFEDDAYPLPDYQAGIPYIDADTEIGNFVKNNVKNGFTAGLLVQFFGGEPQPEQKAEIEKMWHDYLHGSENAGKALMAFLDDQEQKIDVTPLSANGQDDRYTQLNNQICNETFIAHTTPPEIVGLTGDNGFSNDADAKRTATVSFNNDFVESAQEPFNEFANQLLEYNEIRGEVELQKLEPILAQLSETALLQIYGPKQLAQIVGLPEPELEVEVVENSREIVIKLSKDDQDEVLIEEFQKLGTYDDEFEILSSKELYAYDIQDAQIQSAMQIHEFASVLQNTILRLLAANPLLTTELLSKLLDKSEEEVEEELLKMQADGLLNEDNEPISEPDDEVFTVYKYEKRSDVSGLAIIDTTRPFCRNLVTLSKIKSWTIEDIKAMNNGTGLDVFRSRGGWYTIPNSEPAIHVPFCRHIWKSILVRRAS
jgi:hypothetical protein